MEPANRKLIRPSFVEVKEQMAPPNRRSSSSAPVSASKAKKIVPPEQTNAENFYYLKQMQAKTPMVIVLQDGETLDGIIEWYDRSCLKVNREGQPNLVIYKQSIKYLYKAE